MASLALEPSSRQTALPVPWRDPNVISPEKLTDHIALLERACIEQPLSADLRTCLGMAYAMNYQAYESMDALEAARQLEPDNFWAQFKYAELHYRLRALPKAEEETIAALELAIDTSQVVVARTQLLEVRRRIREGTQKPAWNRPLAWPVAMLAVMFLLVCLTMNWR